MVRTAVPCALVLVSLLSPPGGWATQNQGGGGQEGSNPHLIDIINEFNDVLRAEWMDLRVQVEQLEVMTPGPRRPGARMHSQTSRWVPGDSRRAADGNKITYLVDLSDGTGNLHPALAERAIDRAMETWSDDSCMDSVRVVKRQGDGSDPDLLDGLLGYGGFGDFRAADIVHAGWLPSDFFEDLTGPGGEDVVALSVTFIFVDRRGVPTDIDRNGYLDTAANEIYYNKAFARSNGPDLESVALHEIGHALGLRHGDAPPWAVMYPVYSGIRRRLTPSDRADLCPIWSSWPRR